jgi:hypothetical protein
MWPLPITLTITYFNFQWAENTSRNMVIYDGTLELPADSETVESQKRSIDIEENTTS